MSARLVELETLRKGRVERLTSEGVIVGTFAYMAPEQALGRPPEPRSDLYALGAMLYEMVAGRPPFVGDDPIAVVSQHINAAPRSSLVTCPVARAA